MENPSKNKEMADFEDRLRRAKKSIAPNVAGGQKGFKVESMAWRMVIELVVGMMMGIGIGYGLDYLFGTMPIFLILFTLLGFAAGIRTMMRTAGEMAEAQEDERVADAKNNKG